VGLIVMLLLTGKQSSIRNSVRLDGMYSSDLPGGWISSMSVMIIWIGMERKKKSRVLY
jgi:hypothetical protein